MSEARFDLLESNNGLWSPTTLYDKSKWLFILQAEHHLELFSTFGHIKKRSLIHQNINWQKRTILPKLSFLLRNLSEHLNNSLGFFLIKNFPVDDYELEDLKIIYASIISKIGMLMPQDLQNTLVMDVCKQDNNPKKTNQPRGPFSNDPLTFHTDRSDLVALLCLNPAYKGGVTSIVSAAKIHNIMLEKYPKHLEALYKPYYYARANWEKNTSKSVNNYYELPVFSICDDYFSVRYLRFLIDAAENNPGCPSHTPLQLEAIDLLEYIANEYNIKKDLYLEKGDLLIINNYLNLHARDAFVDMDKKRHLLRCWVSLTNSRPKIESFSKLNELNNKKRVSTI